MLFWAFARVRPDVDNLKTPETTSSKFPSELDALLSERPAKKRAFPRAKMSDLVAALRKLDDLPNRAAQLQALCNMPDFREFKTLFFARRRGKRRATLGANRGDNRYGIRDPVPIRIALSLPKTQIRAYRW